MVMMAGKFAPRNLCISRRFEGYRLEDADFWTAPREFNNTVAAGYPRSQNARELGHTGQRARSLWEITVTLAPL
jgi:hypothetical protein